MTFNPQTGQWEDDAPATNGAPGSGPPNTRWNGSAWVPFGPTDPEFDPTYGGYSTGHDDAFNQSVYTAQGWSAPTTTTAPTSTTTPTTGIGPYVSQYQRPAWLSGPDLPWVPDAPLPDLPTFEKPPALSLPEWKGLDLGQILANPTYQFRQGEGRKGVEAWAAAKGTLNDTGTADALIRRSQDIASQEVDNVWNREMQAYLQDLNRRTTEYTTNYGTQYVDPYKFNYQRGLDLNAPRLETWRAGVDMSKLGYATRAAEILRQNELAAADAWNQELERRRAWESDRDWLTNITGA